MYDITTDNVITESITMSVNYLFALPTRPRFKIYLINDINFKSCTRHIKKNIFVFLLFSFHGEIVKGQTMLLYGSNPLVF